MDTRCPGCGLTMYPRRYEAIKNAKTSYDFPIWREHCRRCDIWVCGRGHQIDPSKATWWNGADQRRLAACTQGACGIFNETWWKLWRRTTESHFTPEVKPSGRKQLYDYVKTAEPGPKREAVSEFLNHWSPQTVEELFEVLAQLNPPRSGC